MAKIKQKQGHSVNGGKAEKGSSKFTKTHMAMMTYLRKEEKETRKRKEKEMRKKNPQGLSEVEKSAQQLRKGALGKRCQPSASNSVVKKKPKKKKGEKELKRDLEKLRQKQKGLETQFSQLERKKNREIKDVRNQINQLVDKIPEMNAERGMKNVKNQTNQADEKIPFNTDQVETRNVNTIPRKLKNQNGLEDIELQLDKDGFCIIYTCGHHDKESGRAGIGVWFGPNNILNMAEPFQGTKFPFASRTGIQAATLALNVAKFADIKKVHILLGSMPVFKLVKQTMSTWEHINWDCVNRFTYNTKDELSLLRDALEDMTVTWDILKLHFEELNGIQEAITLAMQGAMKYVTPVL